MKDTGSINFFQTTAMYSEANPSQTVVGIMTVSVIYDMYTGAYSVFRTSTGDNPINWDNTTVG